MLIYGLNSVAEAVRAGRAIEIRVASRSDQRLRELIQLASSRHVRIRQVAREVLDAEAEGGVHQGVVAEVKPRPAATLADLARARDGHPPLIVVLDGVEDPQNVGAIVRSVDAAGGNGVVRQTRHAAPLGGAVAKASAGAVHHVAIAAVVNIARAVEELKELGVWTAGLDAGAETPYYELDLTVPIALVVGAEGRGLRRLVRERCDFVASIPMSGRVSSLNVSAAAAIVLFEAVRQRKVSKRPLRDSQAREAGAGDKPL